MAAPNLAGTSLTINAKSAVGAITTTLASVLSNGAASGKLLKVEACLITSIDNANDCWVSASLYRSATHRYFAYEMNVPAKTRLDLLERVGPINLEEGDAIYLDAEAASDLEYIIPYLDIS